MRNARALQRIHDRRDTLGIEADAAALGQDAGAVNPQNDIDKLIDILRRMRANR